MLNDNLGNLLVLAKWKEYIDHAFKFIMMIVGLIGVLNGVWKDLAEGTGTISKAFYWFSSLFRSNNQAYVRYKSIRIKTLITQDPKVINRWCTDRKEEFLQEGVSKPASLSLFIPEDPTVSDEFLTLFVFPDNCLVYKISKASMVPLKLRRLLGNPNFVYFVDSPSLVGIEQIMRKKAVKEWVTPRNIIELNDVLEGEYGNIKGFSSLDMANFMIKNFNYTVPRGIRSTNWGVDNLKSKQVQFLTMGSYAGYLVANEKELASGSFFVSLLSEDDASGVGSSSGSAGNSL